MTDTIREQADSPLSPIAPGSLPWRLGGDPDNTCMGPVAIQVRRGAEVLGYDPEHLTDQQRGMVETTLQDPAQNMFIASEYLAQLKAESEFADVPAEEMTPAQYQELAARYNGGPGVGGGEAVEAVLAMLAETAAAAGMPEAERAVLTQEAPSGPPRHGAHRASSAGPPPGGAVHPRSSSSRSSAASSCRAIPRASMAGASSSSHTASAGSPARAICGVPRTSARVARYS